MSKYSFIIDTNSYSGNFEREMCAFLTGQVGECGVGDEHVEEFQEQFPNEYAIFEDIIGSESDDNGYYRPCEITETPGRFNHGMGENFDDDADMEIVRASFVKKVDEYYLPLLERAEKAIENGHVEWKNDAQGYKDRMREARENPITKHPASESVLIHFCKKPSTEIIEFMKRRALEFAETQTIDYNDNHCKILGFRMEEHVTTTTSIPV
jgi:hypothetical protein